MSDPISFVIRLTNAEWDEVMGGWHCPVLQIPGAIIEGVYVGGNQLDSGKFQILQGQQIIRWVSADKPERLAAVIRLTKGLALETETEKWRKRAVVLPFVASIAAALITAIPAYWSKFETSGSLQNSRGYIGQAKRPETSQTSGNVDKYYDDWLGPLRFGMAPEEVAKTLPGVANFEQLPKASEWIGDVRWWAINQREVKWLMQKIPKSVCLSEFSVLVLIFSSGGLQRIGLHYWGTNPCMANEEIVQAFANHIGVPAQRFGDSIGFVATDGKAIVGGGIIRNTVIIDISNIGPTSRKGCQSDLKTPDPGLTSIISPKWACLGGP